MHPVKIRGTLECDAVFDEYEERSYLGISMIDRCPLMLGRWLVDGRDRPGMAGRRLFHEGYLHERDVIARFEAGGVLVANRQRLVTSPDDARFCGHIDGEIDGELLEIKSVTTEKFEQISRSMQALEKHLGQVRLYMRFGDYQRGVIVYKDRQFGELFIVPVFPHAEQEERLMDKAFMILNSVDRDLVEKLPCECGRCAGGV